MWWIVVLFSTVQRSTLQYITTIHHNRDTSILNRVVQSMTVFVLYLHFDLWEEYRCLFVQSVLWKFLRSPPTPCLRNWTENEKKIREDKKKGQRRKDKIKEEKERKKSKIKKRKKIKLGKKKRLRILPGLTIKKFCPSTFLCPMPARMKPVTVSWKNKKEKVKKVKKRTDIHMNID